MTGNWYPMLRRHALLGTLALSLGSLAPEVWAAWGGPISVDVAPVRVETVNQTLYLTGDLIPLRRALVGAEEEGRVAEVFVDEGSTVRAGDPLVALDRTLLALQVSEEEAALASAMAELEKYRAGLRQEEIEQARARMAARQAELESARTEYETRRQLVAEGVVSTTEFTLIEALFNAASARLAEAEADLEMAQEGFRAEDVAAAQARAAEARARVAVAREALRRAVVRAPFDAAVVRLHTELGAWLRRGDAVAELIDLSHLEVVVEVPEPRIPDVRVGQAAELTVDAYAGEVFTGEVIAVVPDANLSNRTYPVHVRVANPDRRLLAGMFGRVAVITERQVPVLLMPADALVDRGRGPEVWRVAQGLDSATVEPVSVTIGRRRGTDVEVLSGLDASDEVVTVGREMLHPGAQIALGGAGAMPMGGPPGPPAAGGGPAANGPEAEASGRGPVESDQ